MNPVGTGSTNSGIKGKSQKRPEPGRSGIAPFARKVAKKDSATENKSSTSSVLVNATITHQTPAAPKERAVSPVRYPIAATSLINDNPDGPATPIQHWLWCLAVPGPVNAPSRDDDSIANAIRTGRQILEKCPDLSINDRLWWTVWEYVTGVMAVVANGGGNVAIALINELGADPFLEDCQKKHLLHLLIAKGHKTGRGNDHQNQYPIFSMIVHADHLPVAQHINHQDRYGLTPLHYACARQDPQYIEPLIKRGSDPAIKDINQNHCLDILLMDEQQRTNLVALALAPETLIYSPDTLRDDYLMEGDTNYFFNTTPLKKAILESPNFAQFVDHNLAGLASVFHQSSKADVTRLTRLLKSAMTKHRATCQPEPERTGVTTRRQARELNRQNRHLTGHSNKATP